VVWTTSVEFIVKRPVIRLRIGRPLKTRYRLLAIDNVSSSIDRETEKEHLYIHTGFDWGLITVGDVPNGWTLLFRRKLNFRPIGEIPQPYTLLRWRTKPRKDLIWRVRGIESMNKGFAGHLCHPSQLATSDYTRMIIKELTVFRLPVSGYSRR